MADPVFLKAPDGNYVHFEWTTEKNEAVSEAEGRPMYDKILLMHVVSPGSPKSAPAHVVEREKPGGKPEPVKFFEARYGAQIEAYKRAEVGGELAGTPLDQLPFLDISTRATLRALQVHTAEALADLGEQGVQNVGMGARMWKQQAVAWLEAAKGGAPMTRLLADNDRLTDENKRLTEALDALAQRVASLETSPAEALPRARARKADAA